jgi:hypothetical protein
VTALYDKCSLHGRPENGGKSNAATGQKSNGRFPQLNYIAQQI